MAASSDTAPLSRIWLAGWCGVAVLVCVWIALGPLEGVPHVQDEVVYQFQARLLSEGSLWEAERLPRAVYHYDFITNADGRRYGVFPIGWPLILAIGTGLGVPWLVNPMLHGGLVWLASRFAERVSGPRVGWLAAPVVALCPALVWQGSSRMAHPLCALLALGALRLATDQPSIKRTLALGACLAVLLLTRPIDAIAVGVVLAVWRMWRGDLLRWSWAGAVVAAGVVAQLWLNYLYEGDPLVFPQHAWFGRGEPTFPGAGFRFTDACNQLGFGEDRGCAPTFGSLGHTVEKGARAAWLNVKLAGSAWFGFAPVAVLSLAGAWAWGHRTLVWLLAATWSLVAAGYATYWYGGVCLGPRFHHIAAPLAVLVLAAGVTGLVGRYRWTRFTGLAVLLPLGWTLLRSLPEFPGYWGVDDRLSSFEERWTGGPALMFVVYGPDYRVDAELPLTTGGGIGNYWATQRRGMWLERRNGIVEYAEYQPQLVEEVRRQHPDREAFILVLTSDAASDRVLPLPASLPGQRTELSLPVAPVALSDLSLGRD